MTSRSDKSENWDNPINGMRQRVRSRNPLEIRVDEALNGKSRKWLAEKSGIAESTLGNGLARGVVKSNDAIAIARALECSLDWLLTGAELGVAKVVDAADADWVHVPKYDLSALQDDGLGTPTLSIPMRKDWLYAMFRASSALWLTRLLSDYQAAKLKEGEMVICRTISRNELAEGHICLWRYDDTVVIGLYSVQPDATLARGMSREGLPLSSVAGVMGAAAVEPMTVGSILGTGYSGRDLVIAPSQIGDGDGHYQLVGRILGVFIRPLQG